MAIGRKAVLAIAALMLAGCAQGGPNIVSRFDSGDVFQHNGAKAHVEEPAISSRSQISLL